ncbi:MAG: acetate/propionate family kinase [Pseudomonadota bacterium]
MNKGILTLNTGSSSIKLALFPVVDGALQGNAAVSVRLSGIGDEPNLYIKSDPSYGGENRVIECDARDQVSAIEFVLRTVNEMLLDTELISIGHRVVHGGASFAKPCFITPPVVDALGALTPLAPGHQPANLQGVCAAMRCWPQAPQVGCFDTSFHRTQPKPAMQFAIPRQLMDEGIIRYGFHGLSYEYIAEAAPTVLTGYDSERMIVAHLGAGASMCAIRNGRSVATTMGFTALDGLPMGTRCGDLDPGVILYLLQEKKLAPSDIAEILYEKSGLLGLSQISGDMRILENSDHNSSKEAVEYFAYRCIREIGSLTAALGGLDALIFTAGIGENSASVRARILDGLGWLGFEIDKKLNQEHNNRITAEGITPSAWVLPTNEELMIARHAFQLLMETNSKSTQ